MIIKQYELKKINLNNYRIYLFYGKNDGLKNDIINILGLPSTTSRFDNDIWIYIEIQQTQSKIKIVFFKQFIVSGSFLTVFKASI